MGCVTGPKNKNKPTTVDFLFFLSLQHPQPAYTPAFNLLFSGTLTCIFASILGEHVGSVELSRGQKMAKNRVKPHYLGHNHPVSPNQGTHFDLIVEPLCSTDAPMGLAPIKSLHRIS